MSQVLDVELVNAARMGDPNALEELLMRHRSVVKNFARKYCATPEDVEDAVQEALLAASKQISRLQVASAFVGWLFQVVKNSCFRLLRYKQTEDDRRDIQDLDEGGYPSLTLTPESEYLLHQDVITALNNLPIPLREIIILRDIERLTAPEVALELGITIETVKSRLHRGRALLRDALLAWRDA